MLEHLVYFLRGSQQRSRKVWPSWTPWWTTRIYPSLCDYVFEAFSCRTGTKLSIWHSKISWRTAFFWWWWYHRRGCWRLSKIALRCCEAFKFGTPWNIQNHEHIWTSWPLESYKAPRARNVGVMVISFRCAQEMSPQLQSEVPGELGEACGDAEGEMIVADFDISRHNFELLTPIVFCAEAGLDHSETIHSMTHNTPETYGSDIGNAWNVYCNILRPTCRSWPVKSSRVLHAGGVSQKPSIGHILVGCFTIRGWYISIYIYIYLAISHCYHQPKHFSIRS